MTLFAMIFFLQLLVLAVIPSLTTSFVVTVVPQSKNAIITMPSLTTTLSTATTSTTQLSAIYTPGRSSSRSRNDGKDDKSKRQFRVGELVRTELGRMIHSGVIKGNSPILLESELRQRISVVSVDISPDLRQARVSFSVRNANINKKRKQQQEEKKDVNEEDSDSISYYENDPVVDKRRAFSWLVDNTNPIRHTLAQKMSHMKVSPSLTFVQVDVAAATDVMYLIDKVSKGYQREEIGEWDYGEDDGDDDDDDDWDEMDDDFFDSDDDE
jgi:ribosome-binding factor A